jgi:hypothetical protein
MSEDYATDLVGQIGGGIVVIAAAIAFYYGVTRFVDWRLTRMPKK